MRRGTRNGTLIRSGSAHILEPYTAASLLSTLTTLGLTTNLKLCLDAGDGDSYTSGQQWTDLSGNGCHFNRGSTSGAEGSDPTFNGVADALSSSEYFSFDGGDTMVKASANDAFLESIHKDSARFTFAAWLYPAGAAINYLMMTSGNLAGNVGFAMLVNTAGNCGFNVSNGSGTFAKQLAGGALGQVDGAWQFFAISADETGQYFWMRNAVPTTPAVAAYTSPSAASATATAGIGVNLPNGARLGMVMGFDTNLTAWQLEQIYNKTRRRFGV